MLSARFLTPVQSAMPHSPLVRDLRKRLGAEDVLSAPSELAVYDCDGYTIEKHRPDVVVFPRSPCQVAVGMMLGFGLEAMGMGSMALKLSPRAR